MNKSIWLTHLIELAVGVILVVLCCLDLADSFWSGMGGALIAIGLIRLHRAYKLMSDPEYLENFEIEINDERNKYIRTKAWSWAGYLFVIIAACGTIAFKLAGREDLMMFCSGCVCLVLVLYWIIYMVLKNKY